MATAKKQPSGMWKCRVYSHTTTDGKKHYRAFTAPTKQEAEQQAAAFSGASDRAARVDLTVDEAIKGYIDAKEAVLSPSTVRGYRQMQRTKFEKIGAYKVRKLNSAIVQQFISDLSKEVSAKTVMNAYGLLMSSIALYLPEMKFRVKLPRKAKRRSYAATDAQIMALYDHAPLMLKKCIALAAFTSMRRGEICALKYKDIQGNAIHICADMVHDDNGKWIYKPYPKTEESDRIVPVPKEVLELLGNGKKDDYIIEWCPDTVTKRFIDLRNALGLGNIRFHDLRVYFGSIAASIIPDLYAESFGGWGRGSRAYRERYRKKIDPLEKQYADAMREHFSGIISKV